MLFYALTLLSAVMALPQPLPALGPLDEHPTLTTVNFAKTTRRSSGTKTTKVRDADADAGGGGGGVTKVINHTVTTGRYRVSGLSKPAIVSGKLAGIIIGSIIAVILLLVLAVFIYKKRKAKKAAAADQSAEDRGEEEEVGNEKEVEVGPAPVVLGEMGHASQPAIPHGNTDMIPQQPKVVELGADGVVATGAK